MRTNCPGIVSADARPLDKGSDNAAATMRAAVVRMNMISSRGLWSATLLRKCSLYKLRFFRLVAHTVTGGEAHPNKSPTGPASPARAGAPVGIAEIDAVAAARPVGAAFDGD